MFRGKLDSRLRFFSSGGCSRLPDLGLFSAVNVDIMLIRAIVSGLGERIGSSRIGLLGADEVKGREDRLRGSGRLKGAGSATGASEAMAGRR